MKTRRLAKKDLEKLIAEAKRHPFRPVAWYNQDGDIIEAVWEDCSYYAEYLNPQITLLRSNKTKEIVGVEIWALDEKGKNVHIRNAVKSK